MRAAVENIRGVQCGDLLSHLMEKGLVKIAGRTSRSADLCFTGRQRSFCKSSD